VLCSTNTLKKYNRISKYVSDLRFDDLVKSRRIVIPVANQARDDVSVIPNILNLLDSGFPGFVAIGQISYILIFVIPGLTRARSEALALSSAFSKSYVT
jgi:hypothetical protein